MATKTKNPTERTKKSLKEKFGIDKAKVLKSLLAGFAAPFILILCSGFNVFFTNAKEFGFNFGDFAPLWILFTLIPGCVAFLLLLFTKKTFHNVLFALCSFAAVAGFIQYMITTLTFKGLPGDHGVTALADSTTKIVNFALWVIIAAAILWFAVLAKNTDSGRRIITFLLILVTVMQLFYTGANAVTFISENSEGNNDSDSGSCLTEENMFEVSQNDNIIVFVIDRFDAGYFESFKKSYPEYLDKLDGFTYYADNISTYPRTYPAVTSMLTGINNDFTSREDYLENAYKNSDFLKDISNNGYKINLYIPSYYSYDNANVFNGMVSNTADMSGHTISKPLSLQYNLFRLSSYFWAPEILKPTDVNAGTFKGLVKSNLDSYKYEMTTSSDAEIYDTFTEDGLSTQSKEGTFTFMHLRGCHAPFTVNENCDVFSEEGTYSYDDLVKQTAGVFKLITEYMDELKDKGLYEDATIIITGDHGALSSDTEEYKKPIRTALLVKESSKADTPLKTSNAQVSQDNLHASIIKSADIKTNKDYGRAYWEISENETVKRTHYFQTWPTNNDQNITYEITGPASDFSNWKITNREDIGKLYK